MRVLRSYQFAATANDEEHLVDEVHREISGFPSGLPICSDSGIDDEDATKFIYNNGNNASTDNITAGVAGRVGERREECQNNNNNCSLTSVA